MRPEGEVTTRLEQAEKALQYYQTLREDTKAQNLNEICWLYYRAGLKYASGEPADVAPTTKAFAGRMSKEGRYAQLRDDIISCTSCQLAARPGAPVPGAGNMRADVAIVGEAPGKFEVQEGYPFVETAPAGRILRKGLDEAGLDSHYIFNTVSCRPVSTAPGRENDPPSPDHIKACQPHFNNQLFLVDPKVILALGGPAGQTLTKSDLRPGQMRGKLWWYYHYPVVVTWHPSYVARNGGESSDQWYQLLADMNLVDRIVKTNPGSDIVNVYEEVFEDQQRITGWS